METLLLLAAAEGGEEASQTPFYVLGLVLVAWALLVTALGSRGTFPGTKATRALVVAVSVVLVAGTITSAAVTG